jgi:aspartate/glutamate racemase
LRDGFLAIINAKIDDKLVKEFRHVIYSRHGLKKGDFKNALEEAMLDYIRKYSEQGLETGSGQLAVMAEKAE